MHNINTFLFHIVNSSAGHFAQLDAFVVFLTDYIAYGVCIAVGIYLLLWRPFYRDIKRRAFLCTQGVWFWFAIGIAYIVQKTLKYLIAHPRPFETLSDIQVLLTINGGDSFPSGHATMTAAVATAAYHLYPKLGIVLWGFAIIIGLSRLYVGVHYPLDIFVGFLIGYTVPTALFLLFSHRLAGESKKD